jgi:signal transduction histidine kinase
MALRSRLPRSFTAFALALVTLSAAWLAALQYRSLAVIVRNQEERRRHDVERALTQAAMTFDFEISRAHMAFQLGCTAPERLRAVAEDWSRLSPHPRMVRGVHRVERRESGKLILSPEAPEISSGLRADAAVQSPIGLQAPVIYQEPLGLLLSAPALPSPAPAFPSAPPAFVFSPKFTEIFVALDEDYLLHDLLPALVRSGSGFSEADYELRVLRGSDGKILSGPQTADSPRTATARTKLFQVRPGCPGFQAPAGGGLGLMVPQRPDKIDPLVPLRGILTAKASDCPAVELPAARAPALWTMSAVPRESAFSVLRAFERRSLLVTSAAALSLAGSLTLLIVLIRRTQELARLQVEFVAGVSHELRTPIGTIGVAADNLVSGMAPDREAAAEYGGVIQAESRRLARLIEQVLSYARTLSPRWQPSAKLLRVSDVVEEALTNSAGALDASGLNVQRTVPANLPAIHGDQHALARCLQNLLDNCAKYARGRGPVVVSADAHHAADGTEVRISIEDRGPGFDRDDRNRLFEPFVRGSQAKSSGVPGFGLGLNIAQRIVEAHHGSIEAFTPACGCGAAFLIRLPAYDGDSSELTREMSAVAD